MRKPLTVQPHVRTDGGVTKPGMLLEEGATHAAVGSRPVDHRLVVGRIPFEHEGTAEQGHLFFPGQSPPEAGGAPRGRCFLLSVRREASSAEPAVLRENQPAATSDRTGPCHPGGGGQQEDADAGERAVGGAKQGGHGFRRPSAAVCGGD